MAEVGQDITKVIALLKLGNLVAIPTETVYGLAANAFDEKAVTKIFEAKNRPFFDPLILHTDSIDKIKSFAEYIPLDLQILLETFSPGPITVLLPKKKNISDLVTAGLPRVAVRIPHHPLTLDLLKSLEFPLAAPSANPFGYISPTSAHHVEKQLGDKIDYILDGGICQVGLESTIIGFEDKQLTVYRKGGLSIEAIEEVVGKITLLENSSSNPAAPGMLKSHYAPNKNMLLYEGQKLSKKSGFLSFCEIKKTVDLENQFILSQTKDLNEAAQNLFKGLRYLDNLAIETIYIELVPDIGLGRAINDRLKRAAAHE
jgi:L-threonylcarbamoyladenylate synthase